MSESGSLTKSSTHVPPCTGCPPFALDELLGLPAAWQALTTSVSRDKNVNKIREKRGLYACNIMPSSEIKTFRAHILLSKYQMLMSSNSRWGVATYGKIPWHGTRQPGRNATLL